MDDQAVKYYFVVNPNAGTRREQKKLLESIVSGCGKCGIEYTLYETVRAGDGEDFLIRTVKENAEKYANDHGKMPELRFYFAGGDGTVLESASAFMKLPEEMRRGRVAVGVLPVGTGNDFLRNFGRASDFLDIERQLRGNTRFTDLMSCAFSHDSYAEEGKPHSAYGANMFNIGFDCQTVVKVNELRGRPLMNKTFAYPIGVALTLVKLPHTELKVTFDDGEVREGKFLLALAANGAYCGGGFYAASEADTNDGKLDVILVNPLGRLKFISIVGKYKKGKLLGTPLADKILYFRKCSSVRFESAGETDICIDGEIERFRAIDIAAVKDQFCFIVPEGAVPEH
ncbi:MAG: hypothetical protein J5950_04790 [Clostridia bacterium]|nr:hypothetical protein [Clostridia bacterium]